MVLRKAIETAVKLSKYDKQAWDSLYFGIRQDIKKGIQTGAGLGTILGNFLNKDEPPEIYDQIQPRDVPKARPAYKTRGRYRRNCRPYKSRNRSNKSYRYSYSSRNKFRYNR